MSRPMKGRRVCSLPSTTKFGPLEGACLNEGEPVIMGVDEYETIRLIDYEGMNQQECSEQLDVSRSTVQLIYDTARRKIARALIEAVPSSSRGRIPPRRPSRPGPGLRQGLQTETETRRKRFMIIAVPAEKESLDSAICQSFGRAPFFCIYDTKPSPLASSTTPQ